MPVPASTAESLHADRAVEPVGRLVEVHHLDDPDVVVGADDARQHPEDGEAVKPIVYRRQEDVQLAEEAGERRDSRHRKHEDGERKRERRVGLGKAGQVADLLDHLAAPAHGEDAGEAAERHYHVDRHVDDHAPDPLRRAGREPDERIADMADGAVGHQPLDVLLADGGEGAEPHGSHRDEDYDLVPLAASSWEGAEEDPEQQRHGGDLGRCGEECGDRSRRALVDIRRPHVEGHRRDFEGQCRGDEHEPDQDARLGRRVARHGGGQRFGNSLEAGHAGEAVTMEQP